MADNTRNDFFPKAIKFAAEQAVRLGVHTMVPGIVQSYNPQTKRAIIQPAIMRSFKDSSAPMSVAPLVDVPIVTQSTGGFMVHQAIDKNDVVMVIFSERGLDAFKQRWGTEVEATPGKYFSDAVAMRWGVETINPVDDEGIVLQNAAGTSYIHLKDNEIRMKVGRGNVRLTDGNFDTWRD